MINTPEVICPIAWYLSQETRFDSLPVSWAIFLNRNLETVL
jgi:hypothetical protein